MTNKPLHASQAVAQKIHERIVHALDGALNNASFAFPDLDFEECRREASWAALRWAYRIQDELAGIPELPPIVPMPDDEEPEAPENWPVATPAPANGESET